MSKRRRLLAGLVTSALVTVLAAGCGGGDDGGGGGSASATNGQKDPVTIGVITSLTGPYSALGQFVKKTADVMAKDLNAGGGIDGRQVKLVYKDDHTDPTQAVTAARELTRDSNVTAIIGPVSSSSCAAIADVVSAAKVPMVTTCATESQVEPIRDEVFMADLNTPAQIEQLLSYLEANGKKRIALLVDDTDFGAAGQKAVTAMASKHNVEVVHQDTYSLKGSSFVSQLTAAHRAQPDATLVWGAGPPLVTIAKEYRQLGFKEDLVFSAAAATPLFLGPAGPAADGVTMASSIANVIDQVPSSNESKALVEKVAKAYRQAYDEPISQFTADACGAFEVLTDAIARAGTDRAKVQRAILDGSVVGCHGTYDYAPDDHHGLAPDTVVVATVKDGRLQATRFSLDRLGQ